MNSIIDVLLIITLIIQIIILIHLFYTNHKRFKEDKMWWKNMNEAVKNQVKRYNDLYPNEPFELKEDYTNEQDK